MTHGVFFVNDDPEEAGRAFVDEKNRPGASTTFQRRRQFQKIPIVRCLPHSPRHVSHTFQWSPRSRPAFPSWTRCRKPSTTPSPVTSSFSSWKIPVRKANLIDLYTVEHKHVENRLDCIWNPWGPRYCPLAKSKSFELSPHLICL